MPRAEASISPMARSATSSAITPGVLVTAMARSRAAARSIRSVPTPKQAMISSRGSRAISSRLAPRFASVAIGADAAGGLGRERAIRQRIGHEMMHREALGERGHHAGRKVAEGEDVGLHGCRVFSERARQGMTGRQLAELPLESEFAPHACWHILLGEPVATSPGYALT